MHVVDVCMHVLPKQHNGYHCVQYSVTIKSPIANSNALEFMQGIYTYKSHAVAIPWQSVKFSQQIHVAS